MTTVMYTMINTPVTFNSDRNDRENTCHCDNVINRDPNLAEKFAEWPGIFHLCVSKEEYFFVLCRCLSMRETYAQNGIPTSPTSRSAIAIERRKLFDGVKRCESLQKANKTTRLPPTVNKIIKMIAKQTERNSIVCHENDIINYVCQKIVYSKIVRKMFFFFSSCKLHLHLKQHETMSFDEKRCIHYILY